MFVSLVPDPANQPMKPHELGVRLPLSPPDGRAPVAPAAQVIPMIPIQTPPASPAGSPRFVDASPEFDLDSSDEDPDHQASPDTTVGHSVDNWLMKICNCCHLWKHMMYMLVENLKNKDT